MRVAIVGAGFGGLAAACHLGGAGHEVTLLERRPAPGGVAQVWRSEGFRIDAGPTIITLPELIDETFAAAGSRRRDHVDLVALDPVYRMSFADGSTLSVRTDERAMADELARFGGADAVADGRRLRSWLEALHGAEWDQFVDRNWSSAADLVRPFGPALQTLRLGGFRSFQGAVGRHVRDPRLRQAFSYQAGFVGASPSRVRAIYALVTYCDTVAPVVYPRGGVQELARQLAAAAARAGVSVRLGTEVAEVVRAVDGRAVGVRLADGERVAADAVVVDVPMAAAYRDLLPGLAPPRPLRRARYAASCVVWSVGARGSLPAGAAHHNVHFGRRWHDEVRTVAAGRAWDGEPTVFVTAAGVSDPSADPDGGVGLFVYHAVPNAGAAIDWAAARGPLRERLQTRLAELGYPTEVVTERWADPATWQAQGLPMGTPFSIGARLTQSAALRPRNLDPRVPGLVWCGSATSPGVGVPMVLLSGRLAAQRVAALGEVGSRAGRRPTASPSGSR